MVAPASCRLFPRLSVLPCDLLFVSRVADRRPQPLCRNSLMRRPKSPHPQVNEMFSSPMTILLAVLSLGTQLVVFLRWMHRRMRDDEIQRVFIRDLALHHLPSIYRALHMIAEQQGITLDETPIVNYVDLRHGGRRL